MRKTTLNSPPAHMKKGSSFSNIRNLHLSQSIPSTAAQTSSAVGAGGTVSRRRAVEPLFQQHDKQHELNEKRALNRSLSGRRLESKYVNNRGDDNKLSPSSKKMYREQALVKEREEQQSRKEQIRREALLNLQKKSEALCERDRVLMRKIANEDPHLVHNPKREFKREAEPAANAAPQRRGGIRTFRNSSSTLLG